MSSINTNLSAITALQSLKATQNAMNKNQDQISTGLRVGEASHNASYWSISTKMKSDNGALGAVKDSLKRSKEMINTFSSAMEKSLGFLNTMKTKIAAGSNPGADLKAIQTELKSSIEGLKSVAASAVFNGQNWLQGDGETVKLVTSYDGQAKSVNFLDIDTGKINLFAKSGGPDILGTAGTSGVAVKNIDISDAPKASTLSFDMMNGATSLLSAGNAIKITLGDGAEQTFKIDSKISNLDDLVKGINNDTTLGALVEARKVSTTTGGVTTDKLVLSSRVDGQNLIGGLYETKVSAAKTTVTASTAATKGTVAMDLAGAFTGAGKIKAGDTITFRSEGGQEYSYQLTAADETAIDTAAGTDDATAAAALKTAIDTGLGLSSSPLTVSGSTLTFTAAANGKDMSASILKGVATAAAGNGVATAAVTGSGTSVANALKSVDEAINKITEGMSMLGANKALIESQEDFIGTLSDSLTAGVSAFIDADMNEVSTRNQALQTQQQLGVQALSMANQNSQMILKLFQ